MKDRHTFAALRRSGRRARAGPVTVVWLRSDSDPPLCVAYSIGRRFGPAVARNRMRRRLRAVIDDLATELAPGAYLVSASPAAAALSPAELRDAVRDASGRAAREAGR